MSLFLILGGEFIWPAYYSHISITTGKDHPYAGREKSIDRHRNSDSSHSNQSQFLPNMFFAWLEDFNEYLCSNRDISKQTNQGFCLLLFIFMEVVSFNIFIINMFQRVTVMPQAIIFLPLMTYIWCPHPRWKGKHIPESCPLTFTYK